MDSGGTTTVPATIAAPDATAGDISPGGSRTTDLAIDVAIALGLALVAFLLRRHLPGDGLFYDDAWQALGVKEGSLSNLLTAGQTQVGWALELMIWSRIAGDDARTILIPALVAGCLGPPALHLTLRRFGFARSVTTLLGCALAVSTTHIMYSTRLKSYTTDILVILGLSLLIARLAPRRWGPRTALAWFVGASLLATFSSITLVATAVAGVVLVLHAGSDRPLRLVAVGGQAVAHGALFLAVGRTYNAQLVADWFGNRGGYISLDPNPLTTAQAVGVHLTRVFDVYPGGPEVWLAAGVLLVGAGLFLAAWSGDRAIIARYAILLVAVGLAGAIAHRLPFGPPTRPKVVGLGRVSLWLVPVIALGLAVVLERTREALVARPVTRWLFDGVAALAAVGLVVGAVGDARPYPALGSEAATHVAMAEVGPDDLVWITRPTTYSFALHSRVPVHLQPTPDRMIGFLPAFDDPRFRISDFGRPDAEMMRGLGDAQRVLVVHARVPGDIYTDMLFAQAVALGMHGFEPGPTEIHGGSQVVIWTRADPAAAT